MNDISKMASMMAIAGGAAFWVANFAISLTHIAADYRAALSISYLPMIVESLLGGLIIGILVSCSLLRYHDRIPAKNPILKSVVLSVVALAVIEGASILINLGDLSVYILIGAILNVPRFIALGVVIGYLYKRLWWSNTASASRGGI